MKTLVTTTNATLTCAVIITAAVDGTIGRRPANITQTLVQRRTGTAAVTTVVIAATTRHSAVVSAYLPEGSTATTLLLH